MSRRVISPMGDPYNSAGLWKSRNVLFMATRIGYGGAETQIVRVSKYLKEQGWFPHILSLRRTVGYEDELASVGIPLHSLQMTKGVPSPRTVWRLVRLLRSIRPAVVVGFMFHADIVSRIAGRLAGVPVIVSSIRNEYFGGPVKELLLRYTHWLIDAQVSNSAVVRDALRRRGFSRNGQMLVIPNGIDLDEYSTTHVDSSGLRSTIDVPTDAFMWLAVGSQRKQKNYPGLIEAFAKMSSNGSHLCIVGAGYMQDELAVLSQKTGLANRIHFLGSRQDVPDLIQAADALVLSSAWEGLPNSVIEAMAGGKPVVATRVGGVPELVEDGITGFIVRAKDGGQLASGMERLMNLPCKERAAMGTAGREKIRQRMAIETVGAQWENLFVELLQRKQRNCKPTPSGP